MKKLAIVATLALIIVGVAAGLSYNKLYFPMKATVQGGGTWVIEDLSSNFWASDVMPDGTTIIGVERETVKVYKSIDEGLTWSEIFQIPTDIPGSICLAFCDSRGNIFVSHPTEKDGGQVAGLWRSADGGATFSRAWYEPTQPDVYVTHWGMCEDEDGILYIGTCGRQGGPESIYRSLDEGVTWEKILDDWFDGKHIHALQYNPYNGWMYCAIGDSGYADFGVWRSKDKGFTWEPLHLGGGHEDTVMSFGFYQNYVFCAMHHRGDMSGQVKRIHDTGSPNLPWEDVFSNGLRIQNWVQLYEYGGVSAMLTGCETGTSSVPVSVWGSRTPPFDVGTWNPIYEDGYNTGYTGTACASHKISKNGWLFVANNFLGHGIRIRFG